MRMGRGIAVVAGLVCLAAAPGCSRKLSSGGGAMDTIFYDWLGMDRGTAYYYGVVLNAHEKKNFAYKDTPDPYLADKCVDAVRRLGTAEYTRLEGQVQVILLLSDVLIEDPVSLAKDQAAGSLALLATRMPVVPFTPRPERGDRFLAQLRELREVLHDPEGRRRQDTPATRQRVASIVEEIGTYQLPNLQLTKDALRWFPSYPFITQETDPTLREVYDRAMVRRSREVVVASLTGAVSDGAPHVRRAAVMGLKTVGDARAVETVAERLDAESNALVRGEIAEYFGAVGGTVASTRLVGLLADDDGGVRHKAHLGLVRVAGTDLGKERAPWEAWLARGGGASAPVPVAPVAPPIAPPVVVPPPVAPPSPPPVVVPPPVAPRPPVIVPPSSEPPPMPPPPPPPPPRVLPPPPAVPPPAVTPPPVTPPGVPAALPPPSRRSR